MPMRLKKFSLVPPTLAALCFGVAVAATPQSLFATNLEATTDTVPAETGIGERHFLPLGQGQQRELRRLIRTDREARSVWREVESDARTALNRRPGPLASIDYEGMLDTDPRRIRATASLRDMPRLVQLGYAYAASGEARHRAAAREIILAWTRSYRPDGNPINENKLEPIWLTFHMLRPYFAPAEQREVEQWMAEVARAGIRSGPATWTPGADKNNWDTKRLKIVGGIGLVLRDDTLVQRAIDGFRLYTADALFPDGTSTDLHHRDALRYHVNALVPLLVFAILLDQHRTGSEGYRLIREPAPSGSSVQRSVEYALPYVRGERTRGEWTGSTAPIDRRRAEAGIAEYQPGRLYDPAQAVQLLELAAYFDGSHAQLLSRVQGLGAQRYPTWPVLVAAVLRRSSPGR
jgi:hypothetical protein